MIFATFFPSLIFTKFGEVKKPTIKPVNATIIYPLMVGFIGRCALKTMEKIINHYY